MFHQLLLTVLIISLSGAEGAKPSIKKLAELGTNLGTVANGNEGQKRRKGKKEFVCSKDCLAKDCKAALTLRWGAYCGIGHSGCPGVKPCDDYDACCQKHDLCVDKDGGIMDADCHTALKDCLQQALKDKKEPWSRECEAADLVKTMSQGMDIANMFSQGLAGALGGGRHKHKMERKNRGNNKKENSSDKKEKKENNSDKKENNSDKKVNNPDEKVSNSDKKENNSDKKVNNPDEKVNNSDNKENNSDNKVNTSDNKENNTDNEENTSDKKENNTEL